MKVKKVKKLISEMDGNEMQSKLDAIFFPLLKHIDTILQKNVDKGDFAQVMDMILVALCANHIYKIHESTRIPITRLLPTFFNNITATINSGVQSKVH